MKILPLDSADPPKRPRRPNGVRAAFTILELLIVIGIMAVLLAFLVPVVSRARAAGKQTVCLSNLRQIAGAFHQYAQENNTMLPSPVATGVSWEASLLPYLSTSAVFMCPSDSELYPAVGSSYDWRDTENSATTLAGIAVSAPKRSNLVLVFESLPGWHEKNNINVATLDGTALNMDYAAAMRDIETDNNTIFPH